MSERELCTDVSLRKFDYEENKLVYFQGFRDALTLVDLRTLDGALDGALEQSAESPTPFLETYFPGHHVEEDALKKIKLLLHEHVCSDVAQMILSYLEPVLTDASYWYQIRTLLYQIQPIRLTASKYSDSDPSRKQKIDQSGKTVQLFRPQCLFNVAKKAFEKHWFRLFREIRKYLKSCGVNEFINDQIDYEMDWKNLCVQISHINDKRVFHHFAYLSCTAFTRSSEE
jgi:hypothetical protein